MMDALQLTKELVAFESPSHVSNAAVSDFIAHQLVDLGFSVELTKYRDHAGVEKVNVLGHIGPDFEESGQPGLAYFCHSDVVPADDWSGPGEAFSATEQDGKLYGRGSCDMKGSAACMLAAIAAIDPEKLTAPLYFGCTADEELTYAGARNLVAKSHFYRELVAGQPRVLIGEPTELEVVYAHKGVCKLKITSHGVAAHSSTRDGVNANLAMIPFLQVVKDIRDETESSAAWQNTEFDPPVMSLNIGINDHTKAVNVTPARSVCTIFYRPLPDVDDTPLIERMRDAANEADLEFAKPERCDAVYTLPNDDFVVDALKLSGNAKAATVSYGTDAGVMTELARKVICGPGSIAQAHTVDEWIALDQLSRGTDLYKTFVEAWCTN